MEIFTLQKPLQGAQKYTLSSVRLSASLDKYANTFIMSLICQLEGEIDSLPHEEIWDMLEKGQTCKK